MTEQSRSRSWLGGCLAVLGITVVGGGALLFWQLRPRTLTPFDSAKAIPETAIAAASLATDLNAWQALEPFATPEARAWWQTQMQAARLPDLAAAGLDYERDIEPALSDALVANVPVAEGDAQPLFVLGIEDKVRALRLGVALRGQSDGGNGSSSLPEIETYAGTPILVADTRDGDRLYLAFRNSFLLVSPAQDVVRQAIDTQRGEIPSYAERPQAKALLKADLDLPNPLARVYIANFPDLLAEATGSTPIVGGLPGRGAAGATGIETLAIGIGTDETGLRVQAVARFAAARSPQSAVPLSGVALDRFPENTIGLIYGRALDRSWQEFESQAEANPELQSQLEIAIDFLRGFQLDLQQDLIGWLDGEFALGAIATETSPSGFGLALLVETSQPETGRQTLEKLDRLARFLPGFTLETNAIAGVEVTQWRPQSRDLPAAGMARGWLDPNLLLITAGMPFEEVSVAPRSLWASDVYSTLTAGLPGFPGENTGYVYLDFERLQTTLDRFPRLQPDASTAAATANLRGLNASIQPRDRQTLQFDLAIALERQDAFGGDGDN